MLGFSRLSPNSRLLRRDKVLGRSAALLSSAPAAVPISCTFTLSSIYGSYTGYTDYLKMADGLTAAANTVAATNVDASSTITADFGADTLISTVRLAPINASFDGWGPGYTNTANMEYATAAAPGVWIPIVVTSGHANGVTKTYDIVALLGAAITCRYIRIRKAGDYVAAGDFWFT